MPSKAQKKLSPEGKACIGSYLADTPFGVTNPDVKRHDPQRVKNIGALNRTTPGATDLAFGELREEFLAHVMCNSWLLYGGAFL